MAGWLKKVTSAVRLALILIATIAVFISLVIGLKLMTDGTLSQQALGLVVLGSVAVLLFVATDRWAKWFFAACCANALRATVMALLGRTTSVPSLSAPRVVFLAVAVVMVVMGFLSYRFVDKKPNWFDSVCLVGAVIALVQSISLSARPIMPALIAVLLLGVSSTYDCLRVHKETPPVPS